MEYNYIKTLPHLEFIKKKKQKKALLRYHNSTPPRLNLKKHSHPKNRLQFPRLDLRKGKEEKIKIKTQSLI